MHQRLIQIHQFNIYVGLCSIWYQYFECQFLMSCTMWKQPLMLLLLNSNQIVRTLSTKLENMQCVVVLDITSTVVLLFKILIKSNGHKFACRLPFIDSSILCKRLAAIVILYPLLLLVCIPLNLFLPYRNQFLPCLIQKLHLPCQCNITFLAAVSSC